MKSHRLFRAVRAAALTAFALLSLLCRDVRGQAAGSQAPRTQVKTLKVAYRLRQRLNMTRATAVVGAVGSTFSLSDGIAPGRIAR